MRGRLKKTAPLPDIRFENPQLAALGIEPMTMAELRGKVAAKQLNQPQRVDFFMLMLVMEGSGSHTVDFIDWSLSPGQMLFVRPGQVQQWHSEDPYEAQLILIDPGALPHSNGQILARELALLGFDEWVAGLRLEGDTLRVTEAGFQQLRQDFDLFSGEGLDIALIRHELMALLTRIAKLQKQGRVGVEMIATSRLTYRLFIQALEASFAKEHSLRYYARRLGYSESTISRACLAAEGRSAKEAISRRVLLEAKRLLAHSTASVAEVAYQLGFSEATNFVKFFRRNAGVTPKDFGQEML
jgi:AraC-like DNA-binding protein